MCNHGYGHLWPSMAYVLLVLLIELASVSCSGAGHLFPAASMASMKLILPGCIPVTSTPAFDQSISKHYGSWRSNPTNYGRHNTTVWKDWWLIHGCWNCVKRTFRWLNQHMETWRRCQQTPGTLHHVETTTVNSQQQYPKSLRYLKYL